MSTEPNPHQDAIDGLRAAADFLDAHPEMPGTPMAWVWVHGKSGESASEDLTLAAEIFGPDVEVEQDKYDVNLIRKFGPIKVRYAASLRDVSEERTVTKEVTERVVPALADRQPASA